MAIAHTFKVISQEKVAAIIRHRNLHYHVCRRIDAYAKAEPCFDLERWEGNFFVTRPVSSRLASNLITTEAWYESMQEVAPGAALSSVPRGGIPEWSPSLDKSSSSPDPYSVRQSPATPPCVATPDLDRKSHFIPSGADARERPGGLAGGSTGRKVALGRTPFI